MDAGIEGRLGSTVRWQATLYNREDRDVLRLAGTELRLLQGRIVSTTRLTHWANSLSGYARGVELLVHRRTPNGLSGWASYSYGFAHNTDVTTGEAFWGDFDQRHTVNVYALHTYAAFCALQCRVHEVWARFFASSMKDDLRYTPSDCFETFPFPEDFAHRINGKVTRWRLPGIGGFNFLLRQALGGGGMASLKADPLAKAFAQMLLDMPVRVPPDVARQVTK